MRYVALLRGINVGGNKKVDMKILKTVFESAGFSKVLTYINSGNVIFDSPEVNKTKLIQKIELIIFTKFKFEVPVIMRNTKEIVATIRLIPKDWHNDTEQRTDVFFLWEKYDNKKSLDLLHPVEGVEKLKYIPGAIIWNLDRSKRSKSKVVDFIGSDLYKNMTARNVNTVRKLGELMLKQ